MCPSEGSARRGARAATGRTHAGRAGSFTQLWPAGSNSSRRDQVIYDQYKADRARRTLRGIDEQVKEAEQAIAGKAPVKRTGPADRRHQQREP
jgi:hypothetical protein